LSNNVASSCTRVFLAIAFACGAIAELKAQPKPTPFTAHECDRIRNNIIGIFKRYEGKLSVQLVADLKEFSRRDCDRSVKLRMMAGTADGDAVAELKILFAARQL
jgi:hypothetical protein